MIVQGTGTTPSGMLPGQPRSTIKDFGPVIFEDGETFSASVSFPDNAGSNGGGSGNSSSNSGDGSGSGNSGNKSSGGPGGIRVLPATGGAPPVAMLGLGVLLIAGGLLVHGIVR